MLELQLNHVSKWAPWFIYLHQAHQNAFINATTIIPNLCDKDLYM